MHIEEIADSLLQAEIKGMTIEPISEQYPNISVKEAYHIQLKTIEKKVKSGEKLIGMKIGLTSKAMQQLVGIDVPDYGHLTDEMLIKDAICKTDELYQPKVEGELAFCLKKTLKGPNVAIKDVYDATDYIVPALEVVDTRMKDWRIKLEDTIADNGSSARFILSEKKIDIHKIDMHHTEMVFERNGEVMNRGVTAEVWGNPAGAVAWLANALSEYNIELKAGSVILSGALTEAISAQAGDVFTATFCGIGSISLKFV